jgi:hypothetical protein
MLAQDGQLRTLATIAGLAATPRFSPDGQRVALLVTLGASKETGATQAGARQVGEIGDKSDEQRLALFDRKASLASADIRPLTPADRYIYEYDWAPDGRSLVVTSAVGNGDNNWWVATLDAVDAATGALRTIAKPATQINMPRVSPDGKTVAFIGGVMSDFGSIGGDVWTVALAGGTPVNRTAGTRPPSTRSTGPRAACAAPALPVTARNWCHGGNRPREGPVERPGEPWRWRWPCRVVGRWQPCGQRAAGFHPWPRHSGRHRHRPADPHP